HITVRRRCSRRARRHRRRSVRQHVVGHDGRRSAVRGDGGVQITELAEPARLTCVLGVVPRRCCLVFQPRGRRQQRVIDHQVAVGAANRVVDHIIGIVHQVVVADVVAITGSQNVSVLATTCVALANKVVGVPSTIVISSGFVAAGTLMLAVVGTAETKGAVGAVLWAGLVVEIVKITPSPPSPPPRPPPPPPEAGGKLVSTTPTVAFDISLSRVAIVVVVVVVIAIAVGSVSIVPVETALDETLGSVVSIAIALLVMSSETVAVVIVMVVGEGMTAGLSDRASPVIADSALVAMLVVPLPVVPATTPPAAGAGPAASGNAVATVVVAVVRVAAGASVARVAVVPASSLPSAVVVNVTADDVSNDDSPGGTVEAPGGLEDVETDRSIGDVGASRSIEDVGPSRPAEDVDTSRSVEDVGACGLVEDVDAGKFVDDVDISRSVEDVATGISVKDVGTGRSVATTDDDIVERGLAVVVSVSMVEAVVIAAVLPSGTVVAPTPAASDGKRLASHDGLEVMVTTDETSVDAVVVRPIDVPLCRGSTAPSVVVVVDTVVNTVSLATGSVAVVRSLVVVRRLAVVGEGLGSGAPGAAVPSTVEDSGNVDEVGAADATNDPTDDASDDGAGAPASELVDAVLVVSADEVVMVERVSETSAVVASASGDAVLETEVVTKVAIFAGLPAQRLHNYGENDHKRDHKRDHGGGKSYDRGGSSPPGDIMLLHGGQKFCPSLHR
ncbi:hypothetical protein CAUPRSCDRAFT_11658, partial [Caulochytrium protostelioides]